MQWFAATRLILIWFILSAFGLTSQSEILIIRHGRSRSRHSIEKDHLRWGLKALDNLTFVESHDELDESAENETNGELNVVSFYENNGTLTPSSNEFNSSIGSFEINFTQGPSKSQSHHHAHHRHRPHQQIPMTTELPKESPTSSSSLAISSKRGVEQKKEIMTNIKSTVDKGIQYLKSHENLSEIKIEINDFMNPKRFFKANKLRSHSIAKKDQPTSSSFKHKAHPNSPMQIRIDGGMNLGIVTILAPEHEAKRNKVLSSSKKFNEKITSQRIGDTKTIRNHQAGSNRIDASLNSNLADVFYVASSTENSFDGNEKMQGDEPIDDKNVQHQNKKLLMDSLSSGSKKVRRTVAPFATTEIVPIKHKESADKVPVNVVYKTATENSHNQFDELLFNDQGTQDNQDLDGTNGESDGDDSFSQNDETFNESDEDVPITNEKLEDSTNINGIYDVEDLYLSDFDETSRNNRKNLLRGRDVVTRFLQIVESQHVLGGNCTAGTALNLGEGVVDRYAQDRFRVEAEVAVNRANMLTR